MTARLGSDLLSEAVKNDSIHLDIMATLSHLHWQITLTFFFSISVCVFFLSTDHEGEETPVNQSSEEELPDYLM